MSIRTIVVSAFSFLFLLVATTAIFAQSKRRDDPTRLTSNEISGTVDSEVRGNFYYYTFVANPGELTLTLTVEPGRKVNDSDVFAFTSVAFSLYDRNAEAIAAKSTSAAAGAGTAQVIARVQIERRQAVVLGISFPIGPFSAVGGRYRLHISGPVDLSPGPAATAATDDSFASRAMNRPSADCLPKRGTLIIKMKNGSKKIIDLSEAETLTFVPER